MAGESLISGGTIERNHSIKTRSVSKESLGTIRDPKIGSINHQNTFLNTNSSLAAQNRLSKDSQFPQDKVYHSLDNQNFLL